MFRLNIIAVAGAWSFMLKQRKPVIAKKESRMFDEEKDVIAADPSTADVSADTTTETPETDAGKSAETLNTDTTPVAGSSPGPVPYSRFQEVNTRKTELERLIEERDAEIRDFRNKQTVVHQPAIKPTPKFADPATQAFYEASIAPIEKELQDVKEYREGQMAEAQGLAILGEIDRCKAKDYKNADKDWVVGKLIANKGLQMKDIANLVRVSHDRENAKIAAYLKDKQEEAKHKAKSPAGSAPSAKTPSTKGKGWMKQLVGAQEVFEKRLSDSND